MIRAVRVHRALFPLVRPLTLRSHTLTDREVLYLDIDSDYGRLIGECPPLPGVTVESIDEAKAELGRVAHYLVERCRTDTTPNWPSSTLYSVVSALDQVKHGLQHDRPRNRGTVAVNGLLTGSPDEVLARAEQMVANAYRVAKLKVARSDLEAEIALVRELDHRWRDHLKLRLDANRGWSWEDAIRFADALSNVPIEYIEEPLRDPKQLVEWSGRLPLCLDESLVDVEWSTLEHISPVTAIVIRPTALGGFSATQEWIKRARNRNWGVTVSSAFESPVGLAHLARFALDVTGGDSPCGFDTIHWFPEPLVDEFAARHGRMAVVSPLAAFEAVWPYVVESIDV